MNRVDPYTRSPPAGNDLAARRGQIVWLAPPIYKQVRYARSSGSHTGTSTNIENLSLAGLPSTMTNASPRAIVAPIVRHLNARLLRPDFPAEMFLAESSVVKSREFMSWEAQNIAPSGETGISHFFKSHLFDQLNGLLRAMYPPAAGETRWWQVIGLGSTTGKADWGLYINGRLRVVVELKPHTIYGSDAMLSSLESFRTGRPANISKRAWNEGQRKVILQSIGQLAHPANREIVRYAVILNESYNAEGVSKRSSALLIERQAEHFVIADRLFGDANETNDDDIMRPVELLFGLSLLPINEYDPPPYSMPRPPAVNLPPPARPPAGPPPDDGNGGDGGNAGNRRPPRRSGRNAGGSRGTGSGPRNTAKRTLADRLDSSPGTAARHIDTIGGDPKVITAPPHLADIPSFTVSTQRVPRLKVRPSPIKIVPYVPKRRSVSVSSSTPSGSSEMNPVWSTQGSSDTPPTSPLPAELDLETLTQAIHIKIDSQDSTDAVNEPLVFYGPVDIHRFASLPRLTAQQPRKTLPSLHYVMGPLLGRGAVWTTHRAANDASLVFKLAYPDAVRHDNVSGDPYTPEDYKLAIKREVDILAGPLKHLQGTVVPILLDCFVHTGDEGTIWAMMMPFMGEAVLPHDLLLHEKRQILDLYIKVHEAGVLHCDVRPDNILKSCITRSTSSFTIIDFERSRTRLEIIKDEGDWDEECDSELEAACSLLGIPSLAAVGL